MQTIYPITVAGAVSVLSARGRTDFPFNLWLMESVRGTSGEVPECREPDGNGQATPGCPERSRRRYLRSSCVTKTYPSTTESATTRTICSTMQTPGISLQTLPKVQLTKDFTIHTSRSMLNRSVIVLQLSVFKLENANFATLELTDTGTPPGG